jgi:hypothetical protein
MAVDQEDKLPYIMYVTLNEKLNLYVIKKWNMKNAVRSYKSHTA